jgi:hypothetical protein
MLEVDALQYMLEVDESETPWNLRKSDKTKLMLLNGENNASNSCINFVDAWLERSSVAFVAFT